MNSSGTAATSTAPTELLTAVEPYLIDGRTADGVRRARKLLGRSVAEAAYELGNGASVSAQDTVPFTLWTAATYLTDYPAAIIACVEAGGDVDTTAAIVGGIVAAHTGIDTDATTPGDTTAPVPRTAIRGVPSTWLSTREPLPSWTWPASEPAA